MEQALSLPSQETPAPDAERAKREIDEALAVVLDAEAHLPGEAGHSPDRACLQTLFRDAGWDLSALDVFQTMRADVLDRWLNQTRSRLATFMTREFATWYAKQRSGIFDQLAERRTNVRQVGGVVWGFVLGLVLLGIVLIFTFVAQVAEPTSPIMLALMVVGGVALVLAAAVGGKGARDRRKIQPPDLSGKHIWLRTQHAKLQQWGELGDQDSLRLRNNVEALAEELRGVGESSSSLLEIPIGAAEKALETAGVDAKDSLTAFWQEYDDPLEPVFSKGPLALAAALKAYAEKQSARIDAIPWYQTIGASVAEGEEALVVRDLLERMRRLSLPRVSTWGERSWQMLIISEDAPPALEELMRGHLSERVTVESAPVTGILMLQWTQGYRSRNGEDTDPELI